MDRRRLAARYVMAHGCGIANGRASNVAELW